MPRQFKICLLLPCVCSMTGNYVFTGVCLELCRGTPSPSHNTSTGPMSFLRYPSDWSQVPPPEGYPSTRLGGYPVPGREYPSPGVDRLCRGQFTSYGFLQKDFLVVNIFILTNSISKFRLKTENFCLLEFIN